MARARQKSRLGRQPFCRSLYARTLRCEQLEDRRLLAVLTVNTDQDIVDFTDGVTSLREAIFAANIVPGADEIVFDFGHDGPAAILLTQGELQITDSLTITGTGAELLTIDASGNDPTPDENNGDGKGIFLVNDGDSASLSDVRITDLTLTGADGGYPGGGAILSYENITLSRSVVGDNASRYGGGIYGQTGSITIENSSFTNNESLFGRGSAIFSRGSVRLADSIVTGNRSIDYFNSSTIMAYGSVEIVRSTISNNMAEGPYLGGAAVNAGGGFTLIDSTISNNINLGGIGGGGAVVNRVINSTISGNDGLGVNSATFNPGGGTHIIDSFVTDNQDSGIRIRHSRGNGDVQILRSTISGNVVDRPEGTFSDRDYGGGALVELPHGGIALIEDCVIDGNAIRTSGFSSTSELKGGGGLKLALGSTASASIVDTVISNNRVISETGSNGFGAGILISGGSSVIRDSLIEGNSADGAAGGILLLQGMSTLSNSTVTGNFATDQAGGIYSSGTLTVSDTDILDNWSGNGGGIVSSGSLNVLRSTIKRNDAASSVRLPQFFRGLGGGILATGNILIADTVIEDNTAADAGGGIYSRRGLQLVNSAVINNEAGAGGGVWVMDGSITQSTISQNLAVIGGGIYASNTAVYHSTVAFNSARSLGGGIFVAGTALSLDHSIIARNSSTNPEITGLLGTTISATHSLIRSNTGSGLTEAPVGSPDANGNLIGGPIHGVVDPMLGPLADNGGPTLTHALLPGSPAINAGEVAAATGVNGVPEQDQRGGPFARIVGGRIDIGAFEVQPATGTLNGDFDGDGDVDGRDFLAWQRGYGSTGPTVTKSMGDATGNQAVDGNDLDVWQETYGDNEPLAVSDQLLASQEPRAESPEPDSGTRLWSLDSRLSSSLAVSRAETATIERTSLDVRYVDEVDRAFDDWRPAERTRFDFGDIVTRRAVKPRILTNGEPPTLVGGVAQK